MKIYDITGNVLLDPIITKAAEHEEELMKSDFIKLSWSDVTGNTLPVGAYIVPFEDGVPYALLEPYTPEQKSMCEWRYEPHFQHPKMYLGTVTFKRPTKDSDNNDITLLDWPYTGFIGTLLDYFCDSINTALGLSGDDAFSYEIIGDLNEVVSASFSTTDILSALSQVAGIEECEYHLDWELRILYFGHIIVTHPGTITIPQLVVGENIGMPSVRSSKDGYWNAFEPQGSTRNISRRAASGEYVQANVRLALNKTTYPDGIIYTDDEGKVIPSLPTGKKAFVKSLIFEDVFPKLDLYAYNVRSRERYLLDDTTGEKVVDHYDASGNPVYKRYAVWYMRLAYPTMKADGKTVDYWTDYVLDESQIIDGKSACVQFQANTYSKQTGTTPDGTPIYEYAETSPLAGRGDVDGNYGFELHVHRSAQSIPADMEAGDTGIEILAGDYEIIFQQNDDLILPTIQTTGIIPKGVKVSGNEVVDLNSLADKNDGLKGNLVNLYNIVMDSRYEESAQVDLANETLKYIANQFTDNNSYTFKAMETAFEGVNPETGIDRNPHLYIGQSVTYVNGDYSLATRVMKLVTKLDYDFDQEITVGNEVLKGSQRTLQEQVQTLMSGAANGSGGGLTTGTVKRIIENFSTPRYLSKLSDDTAQGFIGFSKGFWVKVRGLFGIDADGNATVNGLRTKGNAVVEADIRSEGFVAGASGWKMDAQGNLEAESIRARSTIITEEMLINRMEAQEGDTLYSDNDQVEAVRSFEDTQGVTHYVLSLKEKWPGYFTAQQYGNIVKGIVNTYAARNAGVSDYTSAADLASQQQDNGGNYFYTSWMQVVGTHNTAGGYLGVNQIEVVLYGDTDTPAGRNFPPCELMTIARRGCFLNPATAETAAERMSILRRQRLYEVSVTDGRIVKLTGVNSPILKPGNYGVTIGELPEFVKAYPSVATRITEGGDYLYADGAVVADFIKITKAGRPVTTPVYPSQEWLDGNAGSDDYGRQFTDDDGNTVTVPAVKFGIYYANRWNEQSGQYETHYLTHRGVLWECLQSQPVNGVYYEPKWNSAYWRMVNGNENLSIEFVSSRGWSFRPWALDTVITPRLYYGTVDITEDIADEYFSWTRTEEHPAEYDAARDEAWNAQHKGQRTLHLQFSDMPLSWSSANKAIFTCSIVVNDGKTIQIVDNQIVR